MEMEAISLKKLEGKIEALRHYMIDIARSIGLSHPDTIKCSQELDVLLDQYQKMKLNR